MTDQPLTVRRRYRFAGTETVLGQRRYIWESVDRLPGDSRVERFTCGADWFWTHGQPSPLARAFPLFAMGPAVPSLADHAAEQAARPEHAALTSVADAVTEAEEVTWARLAAYVREYARDVWDLTLPDPGPADLSVIEIRADGYANAHVEGEHGPNGLCSYDTPRECGERAAAVEFVETTY